MNFFIRHFAAATGGKRVLCAFIFLLLCWQLSKFWGGWKEGVSSIFYVIHAPIHEIGHNVAGMMRLPETAVVLAGSVFQLLTPVAIGVYLIRHGDFPALPLCLGWLGFAVIEMAAYMYDTPFRNLTLVTFPGGSGGEISHDFEYLFTRWHCFDSACRIGEITAAVGYGLVWLALALVVVVFVLGFLPRRMPEE